ncbi:VgrG-3 protein [Marinobacterium lacunae]|uniref:VgrG-3 protein n=1 Tax=Marinobacterium lacunae TaxID=1232683 RepID=A0A081G3A5_9GAMM|nr:type VI secretion system tip protein TssI/VgrG [Marinobacterium lacunae]KEA65260.1 VgrG-3 protein [Marinobacterium lacunae]
MTYRGSGLRFHFKADTKSDDSFNLLSFSFSEHLSSLFEGKLTLLSRRDDLEAEDLVDGAGAISLWQDGAYLRSFHGVISGFTRGDSGYHHTRYELTLVPAFARLMLRRNSRIFQTQSLISIVSTLLDEMGIRDYAFKCDSRYETEQREYCVQYRESDFAFIARLAAEAGLFWYFEHSEDRHTLVFCDSTSKLPALSQPFVYNATSGGQSETPFVSRFSFNKQLAPGSVELKDYSFKNPAYSFLNRDIGQQLEHHQSNAAQLYQHYDYPGRYKSDNQGRLLTVARLHALRSGSETAQAFSNQMAAASGYKIHLTDHPETAFNRDWLLVAVTHTGEQGAAAEEANSTTATTYQNTLHLIEGHMPWQSLKWEPPKVDGPQIATVVGPDDEEIYCDEYGRVKIQFPWDRYGHSDDQSSCWVRVSQGWAGGQYGVMAIPRIGHEVIVSFLEGDPDQPIITGRTYHAVNKPPYPLPASKTVTVLRTDTHKGDGFNELRFEDEVDKEEIYVRAQKNMSIHVLNSKDERVEYNRSTSIGHDETLVVANDRKVTVEGDQDHKTTGAYRGRVDQDHLYSIGGDWAQRVAGAIGLSADGDITLKSGSKITLQVGGSFVTVHGGGVDIKGSAINLNSGGSPGGLPMPANAAVLKAAAGEGAAFVAHCPAAEGL